MLQALLRGKLSGEQENSEDLLTSGVFGALSYLPVDRGLMPFMGLARYADGGRLTVPHFETVVRTEFFFWPNYSTEVAAFTEPDVVVTLHQGQGISHIVFFEVKLRSPKSSRPDPSAAVVTDQLARHWCAAVHLCRQRKAIPHLVYVTGDRGFPAGDVDEAGAEFSSKCPEWAARHPFRCAWLPWVEVADRFMAADEPVLRDIADACRRLNLVHFRGFSRVSTGELFWTYGAAPFQFELAPAMHGWWYGSHT